MALMAVAALPQLGGSEDGETPGLANEIITYIALFTVAVGTGGIKPCVSALGGDQESFNDQRPVWSESLGLRASRKTEKVS